MNYWLLAILIVVSYFIGNINFGRILSRKNKVDLSKSGSGNLGATNMYRTMGAKMGYLTLVLDALKGVIAALIGYFALAATFPDNRIGLYACGLAAVIGHIFPVIYKFKGGKGISTSMGVFLVAQPIVTLITFVILFIYVWFFKYVSVASLLLTTVIVVYENLTMPEPNLAISLLTFGIWALTWFAHRANIERLLLGQERETNIQAKIFKDKKRQAKRDERSEEKAEKIEIKMEKKEERAELRQAKKSAKAHYKQAKRAYRKAKRPKLTNVWKFSLHKKSDDDKDSK